MAKADIVVFGLRCQPMLLSLRLVCLASYFQRRRCTKQTKASSLLKKKLISRTISSSLLKKKPLSRTISSSLLKKKLVLPYRHVITAFKRSTSKNWVPFAAGAKHRFFRVRHYLRATMAVRIPPPPLPPS
jgi:hypothetical protein